MAKETVEKILKGVATGDVKVVSEEIKGTLSRTIGLATLVILSLSSMLGSGLFILPAFAQEVAGDGMWFAFVLAASVVLTGAFSKSELASAMPESGGVYIYMERTYGSLMGTISGLGLFASFMLKSAFALVGFAAYMEVITGHYGIDDVNSKAIAMVLLVFVWKVRNTLVPCGVAAQRLSLLGCGNARFPIAACTSHRVGLRSSRCGRQVLM